MKRRTPTPEFAKNGVFDFLNDRIIYGLRTRDSKKTIVYVGIARGTNAHSTGKERVRNHFCTVYGTDSIFIDKNVSPDDRWDMFEPIELLDCVGMTDEEMRDVESFYINYYSPWYNSEVIKSLRGGIKDIKL